MSAALDAEAARRWVTTFAERFSARQVELTDLDRRAGDGDFGTNLAPPLERATLAVETLGAEEPVGKVFEVLSSVMLRAGGTSGPLFGAWFRALARAGARADGSAIDVGELAAAAKAGLEAVQQLGKAEVGDSTMVDALAPAAEALSTAAESGAGLHEALRAAAEAADAGAKSTASLTARRGRASYVGEAAVGVEDPGAVTVALFFAAGADVTSSLLR